MGFSFKIKSRYICILSSEMIIFYILLTLDTILNHYICFHFFYCSFKILVSSWGSWKCNFSSFWKIYSNWKRKGNSQGNNIFTINFHFYLSFILLINIFLTTRHFSSVFLPSYFLPLFAFFFFSSLILCFILLMYNCCCRNRCPNGLTIGLIFQQ